MAEGHVHKALKRLALHWLKERVVDLVANEVKFKNTKSIADAVGINLKRKEIRIIEVKATKEDFKRDHKLFDEQNTYYNHAHYSYLMCPEGIIKKEEVPEGYGLLWVDDYDGIKLVKRPNKNNNKLKTTFQTTLKRTARSLTNTHLFHEENKANRDETGGKFKRGSVIKFVSVPCPGCRKHAKELIKIGETESVICQKCKHSIDLNKAKIKEITGFNGAFIKKINDLA